MNERTVEDPWSVTTRELRAHMRTLREQNTDAVVVTVTDVEGSAYRRPGAKMLVGADGSPVGAVTAGCLEGPVTDSAMDVLAAGEPQREVYDLMDEDDDTWGLGLGCNGIIDVLLEPLDSNWDRPLDLLASGEPVTMLTVLDSTAEDIPVGSRTLVDDDGDSLSVSGRDAIPESVREATRDAVEQVHGRGKALTVDVTAETKSSVEAATESAVDGAVGEGEITVLVDGLEPVPRLLLFGSQSDIHPVCRLASSVGFEVTVHSPRGARDETAFPHAHDVQTGHPTTIADSVDSPDSTCAVVMSHNLLDDQLAVETLIEETTVPYIGLMGPRDRFEKVREGSDVIAGDALDRIATPVGLDLGGGEPIEIALSIVSEALAVSNGRDGGRLKAKKGPIHERIEEPLG